MFNINNYKWLPKLERQIIHNKLLIKEIYTTSTQAKPARWWVLFAGVVLLAGVSNSSQALPENMLSGHAKSSLDLNFSTAKPITLSMMTDDRTGTSNERIVALKHDSVSEEASAVNIGLGNNFSPSNALTRESGSASPSLSRESEAVDLGTERLNLTTATYSGVNKLANNIDAGSTGNSDNTLREGKPLVGEVAGSSPFATIALAVLALLGLVSVARRNDI